MRVLITQSNYVPWRGYFAAFRNVDHVVLLDSVQYTRRDWRNRNRIRIADAPRWLSIPVATKGGYTMPIAAIKVVEPGWGQAHADLISNAYGGCPHAEDANEIGHLIAEAASLTTLLTEINERLLRSVAGRLGITTPITVVRDPDDLGATERLAHIAKGLGATTYVSGPAAQAYMDEQVFANREIVVEYLDYSALPEDPEGVIPGSGEYSLLDLVARRGWDAAAALTSFML